MLTEIALTRLFSPILPYYFVYVLLSLAILGLGLGALLAHWRSAAPWKRVTLSWLLAAAGFGVIVVAAMTAVTASPQWWPIYLLASLLPFSLGGVFLSRAFSVAVQDSGWLYGADLTGAGLGVLAAFGGLSALGPINALLIAALLFSVAGIACQPRGRLGYLAAAFPVLLLIFNQSVGLLTMDLSRSDKTIAQALNPQGLRGQIVFSDWDAFARTDVVAYPSVPNERTVFVDGGAGSSVFRMEGGLDSLAYLRDDLGYVPFRLLSPQSVLIIGPGGGKDIALALLGRSQSVTAVEINPGVVRALDALKEYNGNLHRQPGVDLRVAEGRGFLRSEARGYDLIYLSLVANEAADLAGLALSENYVYTQEAFLDYLAHLRPGGAVALRLHGEPHLQRAFITALKALASTGLSTAQAMRQIVIMEVPNPRSPAQVDPLLMVLASPLTSTRAAEMAKIIEAEHARALFVPYAREEMPYIAYTSGRVSIDELARRLGSGYASPTTDDRPFFYLLEGGLPLQLRQLAIVLLLLIGLWALYVFLTTGRGGNRRKWLYWGYFALIGCGFMLIEIALLQRFSLFLGHPVRSLVVVLGGLLLTSGLGSLVSRRYMGTPALSAVRWSALGIAALCALYLAFLPQFLAAIPGLLPELRILLTLILILPLGTLLGLPFPLGLRLLAAGTRNGGGDVALAWATNGLFAVAGSVAATVIAILYGFTWAWVAGLICYLLLAALVWGGSRRFT